MKKLAVVLLTITTVSSAVGANWVKLSKTLEFTNYLDVDSVKQANNATKQVTYTSKKDFVTNKQTSNGKTYNQIVSQSKADCENNRRSTMSAVLYANNQVHVDSYNWSDDDWEAVVPNTVGATEANAVCKAAGYRNKP